MKYTLLNPEKDEILAEIDHLDWGSKSRWAISVGRGGKRDLKDVSVILEGTRLEVRSETERHVFVLGRDGRDGAVRIASALGTHVFQVRRGAAADAGAALGRAAHRTVKSTMPGRVTQILCKKGDLIEAGQPLLVMEAMKMENEIRSPRAGVVEEISVQSGQKVETGELLVRLGDAEQ